MKRNVVIIYGSGASYASGYIINVKYKVDENDRSRYFKPPTDRNFFIEVPDEYIKLQYRALARFLYNYYPPKSEKSMERVWTDIDINHKHITLDTYNWKKESEEYLNMGMSFYHNMDLSNEVFDRGYFDTSPRYNRYKFLGDCGRDFRRLIHDIYADYSVPTGDDCYQQLHNCIENSPNNNLSYLTFNYDCYLEQSLKDQELKYIGLNDRTDSYEVLLHGGIPIIKLHGSLNWAEMLSSYVYKVTYFAFPFKKEYQIEPKYNGDKDWTQPAIIPPTIFKQEINDDSRLNHDLTKTILQQWRAAITVLSAADIIIIVGYSFPSADHHVARIFHVSSMKNRRTGGKMPTIVYCCGPTDTEAFVESRRELIQGIYGEDVKILIFRQFENLAKTTEFIDIIS